MEKAKIMVVEDEAITAKDLELRLKNMGYEVPYILAKGEEAVEKARHDRPDLLLMDIMLGGEIDGVETARRIRLESDIPVIYLSAYTDRMMAERTRATEPFGYLSKPFADYDLHNTIEMALLKHSTQKKLRMEKEFTDAVLDAQIDTFFVFDPETGKAIRWNRCFREISGYTDEEIAAMKAPDSYYSPEDLKKAADAMEEVRRLGHSKVQLSLVCKDGRKIPTEYMASAINDEKGNMKYIIAVGRDITERIRHMKERKRSLREWETTFNSIAEMISIHDRDYRILKVNKAFTDVVKKPAHEIIGKKCYEVLHGSEEPLAECPHGRAMESMKPSVHEFFEPSLNLYLEISASPIFDQNGEISGSVHVIKDITEFKNKS